MTATAVNFCSHCGAAVTTRVPAGDHLPRKVCEACGTIHYQNPRMVIGALPVWGSRILLCRRAIEPRRGYWTLPAGFMENDETTAQAALRETLEEAGARIELDELYTLVNVTQANQVHMIYRARLLDLDFAPGEESLDVQLFAEADVPWDDIAFRSVLLTLRHYFSDRAAGTYRFRTADLPPLLSR